VHFNALQAGVAHDFQDTAVTFLAINVDRDDRCVGLDLAAGDTTDTDDTQEAVVVQLGDLHLERTFGVDLRRRYVVDDGLEQRVHVVFQFFIVQTGNAVQGAGVDDREVQLLFGGAEVVEQVENLLYHPVRTRARTVDLVDHHDRTQDRKSTRLNSSHVKISYAVFCLKKKNIRRA